MDRNIAHNSNNNVYMCTNTHLHVQEAQRAKYLCIRGVKVVRCLKMHKIHTYFTCLYEDKKSRKKR